MTGPQIQTMQRRSFLARAAACGALAVSTQGWSAAAATGARRIDVHHHVTPPVWLDALKKADLANPLLENWTVEHSLADMDSGGTATAIVSPTAPQVSFLGPEDAAGIARDSNEYVKRLMADHPGRFGMFAMLPLPHIDESLKEIAYAFDVLKADGIGMLTSYGNKWLGHPDFTPLFDELNRRQATVYTHPTTAPCCVNLVQGVPAATVEFGADTTRTITSLIFSGASQRAPDINFIFSHGGGVLTAVAERLEIQMVNGLYKGKFTRETVDRELRRFYYDTAQIANSVTIGALVDLVPVSQVVFGTDYPYRTAAEHVKGLTERFHGADLEAIDRGNALRILPRLRST
jgi:6-methylsalicylate decarboxylase